MPDITDCKRGPGIEATGASASTPATTGRQIAWFIGLYCAGLLATAVVAYFFRMLLRFT